MQPPWTRAASEEALTRVVSLVYIELAFGVKDYLMDSIGEEVGFTTPTPTP
jgi:hypothetical protein